MVYDVVDIIEGRAMSPGILCSNDTYVRLG